MTTSEPLPLPREVVPPSSGRAVAVVVLSVLALLALANAGAGLLLRSHPRNLGTWLIDQKWSLVCGPRPAVDTLVLGDSSGNQGVVTDSLGTLLGGPAVNGCTIGILTAANDAWMLDAYLRAGNAPPRRVIVVHVWDVWRRGDGLGFLQSLAKLPRPLAELAHLDPSPRLSVLRAIRVWVGRYLPLYAEHESLVEILRDPFGPPRFGPGTLDPTGYMRWERRVEEEVRADVDDRLSLARTRPFAFSDVNRRALATMRDLAEEHAFDLYVVNGPVHQEVAADPAFRAHLDSLGAALEEFDASSERVHYLLREPMAFPSSAMSNADHLLHPGALDYTHRIADAVLLAGGTARPR